VLDEKSADVLAPCPFCGSTELFYRGGRIKCRDCSACGPWSHLRIAYAARDKWNERSANPKVSAMQTDDEAGKPITGT